VVGDPAVQFASRAGFESGFESCLAGFEDFESAAQLGNFLPLSLDESDAGRGKEPEQRTWRYIGESHPDAPRFPAVGVLRSSLKDYSNGSNGLLA
jgi:hypothetical protein